MRNRKDFDAGKGYKNKDMNPETYLKRKTVMDCIYYANNLLKENKMGVLPRIDVRICDTDRHASNSLGRARLNDNILWIPERTLKMSNDDIKLTVLHEIAHASFGLDHNESCPIMATYHKSVSAKERDETFLKICKDNEQKLQSKESMPKRSKYKK